MIPIPPTVYIAAAIAVAGFAGGWYASDVISDASYAKLEAAYANERTQSAEASRKAEQAARETEQNWILTVNRATEVASQEAKVRDQRIASLRATNGKLSERIAAITKSSSAACDSSGSCTDLLNYIERAGVLVVELDSFAGEVASRLDQVEGELGLCRAYVRGLSDHNSSK